jgi:hypothetical protein
MKKFNSFAEMDDYYKNREEKSQALTVKWEAMKAKGIVAIIRIGDRTIHRTLQQFLSFDIRRAKPHHDKYPAVEIVGIASIYLQNGEIHRDGGPAIIWYEGGFISGVNYYIWGCPKGKVTPKLWALLQRISHSKESRFRNKWDEALGDYKSKYSRAWYNRTWKTIRLRLQNEEKQKYRDNEYTEEDEDGQGGGQSAA